MAELLENLTLSENPTPLELATFIVRVLDIKKARDIKLIHVEEQTIISDYFVICNGTSKTQVSSLAEEVEYQLSKHNVTVNHNEGSRGDTWYLSDYGSVILHVFTQDMRDYYKLDKLYNEGLEVDITSLLTEN